MGSKVCALIGFGPGLGASYATTFGNAGYEVAALSRSGGGLDVEGAIIRPYACDAGDPDGVKAALTSVEGELGKIDVLIYNADVAQFGPLEDISEDQFELSWRVSVLGLFTAVKKLAPDMTARGSGTIIVSGATASLRGNIWTTAFSSSKAAQRILAQSLAKQLGPKGVHVAYLVIDGVIDTQRTREGFAPDKPDEYFLQPDRIAEAALMVTGQDRSAWTFELDLRPFGENW